MKTNQSTPLWWDESQIRKADYAPGYSGWIMDLGDGTCRYINAPLLGIDPGYEDDGTVITEEEAARYNETVPNWGDRVGMVNGCPDPTQIIERYISKPATATGWHAANDVPAPIDGTEIVITGNLSCQIDDDLYDVSPICGMVRYEPGPGWVCAATGMAIEQIKGDELVIQFWIAGPIVENLTA